MLNVSLVIAAVLVVIVVCFIVTYVEWQDAAERDDLWKKTDSSHYLNEEGSK